MYTYTQNRTLHHEDCLARSLYPWKRSKTRLLFRNFRLVVDDQGNGFASEQWSLVLWPRLCIINQSNSVSWHVLMVWRNNNKHPVFPRIKRFRARCMVKKVGGEQKRGIRSEKFARQAKAWTTEIVWILVHTDTGYKRKTHGFMFTYIKEYPHSRATVCCKTAWIAMLRVLPLTKKNKKKKNLATFIFFVRQVQKWARVKRGKHRNSTCLAPMLQIKATCKFFVAHFTRFYCSRLLKYITMLLVC